MLTSDLVRANVRGPDLFPALIDPDRPAFREPAGALLDAFTDAAAQGWTRAALDETVDAIAADRKDHKVVRGLAKVLFDRSTLAVESPVPPAELRDTVFRLAAARGPLALERGPLDRPVAADILAEVGAAHGLSAEAVLDALYADRPDQQRLTEAPSRSGSGGPCDVDWLLHRYNVALVQAVLLHATRVTITLSHVRPARLRQLLRHVKFHQLIHEVRATPEGLVLDLDGPTSVLKQSTRYGLQLAAFFPAVLLQEVWSLEAKVLWTRAKHTKTVRLTDDSGLRSDLPDTGAYETREQQWFRERWAALDTPWRLSDAAEPLDLGGRAVVVPDFRFDHEGRTAWLEIVGYWRKDYLQRRVELLRRYGPGNLVLAVSRKLDAGKDGIPEFPGVIVPFSEIVPSKDVLAAVEQVAR